MKKHKKNSRIKNIIKSHISNNIREYGIAVIMLFIGIILGVIFVNNSGEQQINEITEYINSFVSSLQEENTVNKLELLKASIIKNIILAVLIWFIGSTVVGMPLVYGIIIYKAFCLSYTISSTVATLGVLKGIGLIFCSVLPQNLILIPSILALSVSGMKLYNSIIKDRRKENIKLEIYRHTLFSIFVLFMLILASFIEVNISSTITTAYIKNIV